MRTPLKSPRRRNGDGQVRGRSTLPEANAGLAPSSRRTDHVSVDLLGSAEGVAAGEAWRALERRVGGRTFVSSWDWTEPWLRAYGDLIPHRFAIGRIGGEVCGIALVTCETRKVGPVRTRRLHLGTAGETSVGGAYACSNRLLTTSPHATAFAGALVKALSAHNGWDELRLDRFAPDAAAPLLHGLPNVTIRAEVCPTVDLTKAREADGDVLATLRREPRRQIRRGIRGLGGVSTEVADGPSDALEILEELIEMHQARWNVEGKPGAFASRRFTEFHRAAVPRLAESGAALLMRVRSGSGTLGCVYHLVDRDQVLTYAMGLMPAERKIKPGFVTLACCMQRCHELGFSVYNHLPEPTLYKWELSNSERHLTSATTVRRGVKPAALERARRLKRWLLSPPSPAS